MQYEIEKKNIYFLCKDYKYSGDFYKQYKKKKNEIPITECMSKVVEHKQIVN